MGTGIRPSIDSLAGQKKWDWYIQSIKKKKKKKKKKEKKLPAKNTQQGCPSETRENKYFP